ncbi:MAG: hypothetical protein K0U47_02155 [Epsilonproteobacteria bacterium]|nr:hypothetical protein [Campylobacterota bacterium]
MTIEFRKIPYTKSEFQSTESGINCQGTFHKDSTRLVLVDLILSGEIDTTCDRCGIMFSLEVNEKTTLKISDGVSEDEDLDTIECHDHNIDFDEIIKSEISSIESDYHYCNNCKTEEGE